MLFEEYKKLKVLDKKQVFDINKFSKKLIENDMSDITYMIELAVQFGIDVRSCVDIAKNTSSEEFALLVELKICSENGIIDSNIINNVLELYDGDVFSTAFRILKNQDIAPKKQYPDKTIIKSFNANRYELNCLPLLSAMYYSPNAASHLIYRLQKFTPSKSLITYLTKQSLESTSISRKNACICSWLEVIDTSYLNSFKELNLGTYPASRGKDKKLKELLSKFIEVVESGDVKADSVISSIKSYLEESCDDSNEDSDLKKSKVFN